MLEMIISLPAGLSNRPISFLPPTDAATLLLFIRPLLNNIDSISSQVKSAWFAPHCEAPTDVITIGIKPIALAAVRTAIFAPGIDPVSKMATVSPF